MGQEAPIDKSTMREGRNQGQYRPGATCNELVMLQCVSTVVAQRHYGRHMVISDEMVGAGDVQ